MISKILNTLRGQKNSDEQEDSSNDETSPTLNSEDENSLENRQIDDSKIDVSALWVVSRLQAKGFEAYLTGGCIRDLLLGKVPKDFDVATSAKPEEVCKIFRNCRLIGRRFLLAQVFFPEGKIIETSTFRTNPVETQEELSEDLLVKHDNVFGSIEDDARRRDLTINGLFYDPVQKKVIDFVGGIEDLHKGVVRTIGDPDIRFREDPVRILRAIKFASKLNFDLEESTREAMKTHAGELIRCAPSRIQEEIVKLLTCGHAERAVQLCREVGVFNVLVPEVIEGLEMSIAAKAGTQSAHFIPIEARNELFMSMMQAVDAIVQRQCEISSAVAFSAFVLPVYLGMEESDQNERHWLDKLCVTWSERIRLTRRDQDHMRLLLAAVHMLMKNNPIDKSVQYLVRKPWFREALLLYILVCMSRKEGMERVTELKIAAASAGRPYMQDLHGTVKRPAAQFRRPRPMRQKKRRGPF